MIIKTIFLASFLIASALATGDKPALALLVQSNFDYSLTRKEFRVHYGGPSDESNIPDQVSIKLYGPDGGEAHSYELDNTEKNKKKAFQFALDNVEAGTYKVAVCEDGVCSEKIPSLTEVTLTNKHKLSCDPLGSTQSAITVEFVDPLQNDWAKAEDYTTFSDKITGYIPNYQTDNKKYGMDGLNPVYKKKEQLFHTAIMHNLTQYKPFFDNADPYCGRTNMLSLHSHILNKKTRKVLHRTRTVNYLSKKGIELFILGNEGPILLESTHKIVDFPADKEYEVWVSLCVTDKDAIESTYCSIPIKKDLTIKQE